MNTSTMGCGREPASYYSFPISCLLAHFEQEETEVTEEGGPLFSLFPPVRRIEFVWLRPEAALVNRDPSGSARSEACTNHALPVGSRLNDRRQQRAAESVACQ